MLSSKEWILRANSVVWLCDQTSKGMFLNGHPPENPRLRRWWLYLRQLKLHFHHIQSLKNEMSDYLHRTTFSEQMQAISEDLTREAFKCKEKKLYLSFKKH